MKKKKNVIRRNSGFIVGCVLAAGVSYFTADAVMMKGIPSALLRETEAETGGEQGESTAETLAPEASQSRVYETDPFTVTASGNVIKGVETEAPKPIETESQTQETDENGNPIEPTDGGTDDGTTSGDGYYEDGGSYDDGSYYAGDGYYDDGSSYSDGYYDDGSYSDGYYDDGSSGGGYSGPSIEIQDPGNGSYSYDDGSSGGGDSSGGGSDVTPSDVIIQGISSRYISESELYNYDLGQLRLIRNEIFALHGRIFNSQDLADYFSQKSWYVPMYSPEDFDANMFYYLNDYEEANLNVILNYEAALAGN